MVKRLLATVIPILFILVIIFHPLDVQANKPTITKAGTPMVIPNSFLSHGIIPYNYTNPTTIIYKPVPHQTLSYNVIEVMRSQVCLTMEKSGIKSDCPTLKELSKYDTSNQLISGAFVLGPNNDYIRTDPQVKNNWMFYSKPIVCVECDTNFFNPDVVKTIFIESKPFTYINKTEIVNNTRSFTSFSDQIIQGCNSATIFYSPKLLNDTIKYFLSDCKTNLPQANKTNTLVDHPFIPENSVQWKYNQYINSVKSQSLGNCINHNCNIPSYGNKFNS